jgi:hypothetical protein
MNAAPGKMVNCPRSARECERGLHSVQQVGWLSLWLSRSRAGAECGPEQLQQCVNLTRCSAPTAAIILAVLFSSSDYTTSISVIRRLHQGLISLHNDSLCRPACAHCSRRDHGRSARATNKHGWCWVCCVVVCTSCCWYGCDTGTICTRGQSCGRSTVCTRNTGAGTHTPHTPPGWSAVSAQDWSIKPCEGVADSSGMHVK